MELHPWSSPQAPAWISTIQTNGSVLDGAQLLIRRMEKALRMGCCWSCREREREAGSVILAVLVYCSAAEDYFVYLATAAVNTCEYRLRVVEIYCACASLTGSLLCPWTSHCVFA